jgi:hypothetical protein
MRDDYQQMQVRKQQEKEVKGKKSKYDDDYGTFKIGGENRSIKKKTYDDHMNSLVLNPTRELSRLNTDQESSRQRGKSNQPSGYNIINHSNFSNGFDNDIKKYMETNYQEKQPVYEMPIPNYEEQYKNVYQPEKQNYENSYKNYQPEKQQPYEKPNYEDNQKYYDNNENLENYNKHYDPKNEIDEAEYQKYYQEYLNSLREANTKDHPEVNELSNDINRMNINEQYRPQVERKPSQNEYMTNKINNQKGSSNIYNLEGDKNNQDIKSDNQKVYKGYLDAQTKDKQTVSTNTNQRFILKKDRSVAANPCILLLI